MGAGRRSRTLAACLALGIATGAGCLQATTYACESDVQCRHPERAGACTDLGWCAYMAPGCDSGWQYSMHAEEPIAGMCVPLGDEPVEGATEGADSGSDAGDPTLAPACEDDCAVLPGDCFAAGSGRCEDGTCVFDPVAAGETCQTGCDTGGFCDASGTCVCEAGDSSSGGVTEDCAVTCVVGEHATAAMCDEMGACIVTCEAPWENCDADPANGCEVPVGLAHSCDASGINLEGGCWTAYCGTSESASATNFGTYHCMDCPTCTEPAAGQCRWCDHDTGNFFPTGSCVCGADLDAVCAG
jgi:hypothetical protein